MTESTASAKTTPARVCWECGAPAAGEHFCPSCGKIQPQPPHQDYFAFFALPRKLALDPQELERRFHQLSWKLHPDNFSTATPYERDLSLEKAAVLNDAYRTLRDPVARVEYLLELEGIRREGAIKQQTPPDLLEEVFALNEHLEELRAAKRAGTDTRQLEELRHSLQAARRQLEAKLEAADAELSSRFQEWDTLLEANADGAARKQKMEEMSEILNRHSYLRNLVRNVTEELEE